MRDTPRAPAPRRALTRARAVAVWLGLVSGAAGAAVPVTLPSSEDPADWYGPLSMAELEVGPPHDGPFIRLVPRGATWEVQVRDFAGGAQQVTVAAPGTPAEREDVVWLAVSLLEPVTTRPLPAPVATAPPTKPAAARPKATVTPPVVVSAEPEPPPIVAAAAPEALPAEDTPDGRWTPSPWLAPAVHFGGSGTRPAVEIGLGVRPFGGDADPGPRVFDPGSLALGLTVALSPATGLPDQDSARTLQSTDLGLVVRLAPVERLEVSLGGAASVRRFDDDQGLRARAVVPLAEVWVGPRLERGRLLVAPRAGLRADLRQTVLRDDDEQDVTLGRFQGMLALRLQQQRPSQKKSNSN